MSTKKTSFKPTSRSRSSATLRGTGCRSSTVPLARSSNVPAAKYDSTIISAEPTKTAAGADAAEIVYELRATDGTAYKIREVIPFDLWVFAKFCDAMIEAGLQDGDDLSKTIGVRERIVLDYPTPGGIGRIKERHPITTDDGTTSPDVDYDQKNASDQDDEFDDFLEDDYD